MSTGTTSPPPVTQTVSGRLVYLMAAASGISVANLYYLQPLLPAVASDFHLTVRAAGALATITQVGYALGMLFIVPLGDILERRRMIVTLLCLVTAALLALAGAPYAAWLGVACLLVGLTTVTPQVLLPLAASLADPSRRGQVVGTVMSGLLVGVLLARTVSGVLGEHTGWRTVYAISAVIMLSLAVAMRFTLPLSPPAVTNLSYTGLLRSLGGLIRSERVLVESSLYGALSFASFSAFWTVLPFFLAQPPYHYASDRVGLFGLIGLMGIVAAPVTGRLTDGGRGPQAICAALALMVLSYVLLWKTGSMLVGLTVGFLMLDLGATVNHISNQARVYALRPEARSRINTVYMTTYFAGGALGSFAGAFAWNAWGWPGLCAAGACFPALALVLFGVMRGSRGVG